MDWTPSVFHDGVQCDEITPPYLARHNDYTHIYVYRDNGTFVLTDGGRHVLSRPTCLDESFLEDVTAWLERHHIRYTPNVTFTGMSGHDHAFNFAAPAFRWVFERLIRAIIDPATVFGVIQRKIPDLKAFGQSIPRQLDLKASGNQSRTSEQ